MMFCAILLSLVAIAVANKDLSWLTYPEDKNFQCGDENMVLVEWKWENTGDWDKLKNKQAKVFLKHDGTFLIANTRNSPIALLGHVTYPTDTSFTFRWPAQFPDDWVAHNKVANDGSKIPVVIEIDSEEDDKLTSFGGIAKMDKAFEISCCPTTYPGCACGPDASAPCLNKAVCTNGKCEEAGKEGKPCFADGSCVEPYVCTNNKCGLPPCTKGSRECTCAGWTPDTPQGTCGSGLYCSEFGICKSGSADGQILGAKCAGPGDLFKPEGSCGVPVAGQPSLFHCVRKEAGAELTCQACTVGQDDCACMNGQCANSAYICIQGRCIVNAGNAAGLPCTKGFCGNGLQCMNNVCRAPPTPAPQLNTDPCAQSANIGSEGCACVKNAQGQLGCQSGLTCDRRGVCQTSSTSPLLLAGASSLAAVAMML